MSLDTKQAQQFFNQMLAGYEAKIKASQANSIDEIRSITIDLSVEQPRTNPLKISFPFRNVRVEEATDLSCIVRLIPENESVGYGDISLSLKDNFKSEFGFSKCFLYWHAQPGRKMILKFFTTSIVDNGQLLLNESSVTQNINIGLNSVQLDALTRAYSTELLSQNTMVTSTTYFGLTNIFDSINPKAPFGLFVLGQGKLGEREVPQGYKLELLSFEYELSNVGTIGTGTFASIDFYRVDKNVFINNSGKFTNGTEYVGIGGTTIRGGFTASNLGIVYKKPFQAIEHPTGYTYLKANQLLVAYVYINGTAVNFRYDVRVIGRLVRDI